MIGAVHSWRSTARRVPAGAEAWTAEVVAVRVKDAVGQYGEGVAVRHLTSQGFVVLERNWRCDLGEIDIVARDGAALVFCEVKTRSGEGYGSPLEAVTWRKARRLRQLAGRWLADHPVRPATVRVDVVGVTRSRHGAPVIEHLRGVV